MIVALFAAGAQQLARAPVVRASLLLLVPARGSLPVPERASLVARAAVLASQRSSPPRSHRAAWYAARGSLS